MAVERHVRIAAVLTEGVPSSISCPRQFALLTRVGNDTVPCTLRSLDRRNAPTPTKGDQRHGTQNRKADHHLPAHRPRVSGVARHPAGARSPSGTRSEPPGGTRTAKATPSSSKSFRSMAASSCASRSKTRLHRLRKRRRAHKAPLLPLKSRNRPRGYGPQTGPRPATARPRYHRAPAPPRCADQDRRRYPPEALQLLRGAAPA
jgi:hypothetical protein